MTTVTRFPPSPTGYLHIGSARTALFNWLYARRHGGRLILRIEDTDRERSTEEAVQIIIDGLKWLNLDWDEGPHFQTARFDRYKEVVAGMLRDGTAYHCYCSRERLDALRAEQMANKAKPRYDGLCRHREGPPPAGVSPVVRFKNPLDGDVVIEDRVRGQVVISNTELDDLIIARSDGTPTYHLSVVVDDIDMGVTHVVRGEDHLNNTPRQINILEALGAPRPVYAHLPMINGTDGKKLSKRHGAISVLEYEKEGILPQALLNYLVRLGWSHGDQEIFSLEEMIANFDIDDVNKSAGCFDPDKLKWVNQQYIQAMPTDELAAAAAPFFAGIGADLTQGPPLGEVVNALRERAQTLVELAERGAPYYMDVSEFEAQAAKKHLRPVARNALEAAARGLASLQQWSPAAIHDCIAAATTEIGETNMGKVAQPLRVAVTGSAASPGIDVTVWLVGQARTLARIQQAIAYIDERASAA